MLVLAIVFFPGLQRSLIYVPYREAVPLGAARMPIERIDEIEVRTEDDLTLHGWLSRPAGAPRDETRRLVILFPGNAGHRAFRVPIMEDFNSLGWDCLICDYRGYAGNPGKPSEEKLARDAHAVWEFARQRGYPADHIVLCGESLGGGVATRLASELCQAGEPPAGLILRTTFTSLADTAQYLYPFFPVRWFVVDRYPSVDRIVHVTCPILVMHGDQDEIVPYEQGVRLFEAAPESSSDGTPKTFITLRGSGHNDLMMTAEKEIHAAHADFLEALKTTAAQPALELKQ